MRNYRSTGETLQYAASGAVSAGDLVIIGSIVGVAMSDIAANTTGTVAVEGVFDLVKADTANAYTQGTPLYWDATNTKLTTTASTNTRVGIAAAAAASAATIVSVKINA